MGAATSEQEIGRDDRYKWVALANTTASVFMATLDSMSSQLISQIGAPDLRGCTREGSRA